MPEPRIVSLIASATEIVCALGLESQLVGRSHECDYPRSIEQLPQCTSPKFPLDGTSYQIDQRVKAILQESLSVYRVDAKLIEALKPTHIITQAQCQVCAVSLSDVEEAVCRMTGLRPVIVSLEPNRLADVWDDIRAVGDALSVPEQAGQLIERLATTMADLKNAAAALKTCPTVACIEWIDPLMAAGNWMPELVEMSGGANLLGVPGKHSPAIDFNQLAMSDPDIILIAPCGFDLERTLAEARTLSEKAEWSNLRAFKNGQVTVADGNQYFNRPGPRLLESLQILAEIVHPEEFNFGHAGKSWVKLGSAN